MNRLERGRLFKLGDLQLVDHVGTLQELGQLAKQKKYITPNCDFSKHVGVVIPI